MLRGRGLIRDESCKRMHLGKVNYCIKKIIDKNKCIKEIKRKQSTFILLKRNKA